MEKLFTGLNRSIKNPSDIDYWLDFIDTTAIGGIKLISGRRLHIVNSNDINCF